MLLAKCPVCDISYEFSPKSDDPNSYCYNCKKCHICFCALCSSFPFHFNRKCNKNEKVELKSKLNIKSDKLIQISDHSCEKLDLDEIIFVNDSLFHPSLSKNLLSDVYQVSMHYCQSNLIQLNRQDNNDDLKKQIFDKMNVYICRNHRNPVIFILGHKNDCEIDNSEMCPICHCDQFPICPEHKYEHMSYKCCKCCSTATHIEFKDRKFRFLCDICFQTGGLNEINASGSQGEKKGRFFPYSGLTSQIVGRCDKCERLFVL